MKLGSFDPETSREITDIHSRRSYLRLLEGRKKAFLKRDELLRAVCEFRTDDTNLLRELGMTKDQLDDVLCLPVGYFTRLNAIALDMELQTMKRILTNE